MRTEQALKTERGGRCVGQTGQCERDRLTEYERWRAQVGGYTDRLVGAVVASGQYAGAEIQHATREFIIFAVGEPSPPVAAVLQQAPDIVRITWRQAPYSHAELTSEMRRIMSGFRGRLTSGGARHDGTGIEFTTTDAQLLGASDPRAVLECRYPVTIEYGESSVSTDPPAERSADCGMSGCS